MTRRTRGGENHVSLALWTDELGRSLAVEQVQATLIYLDGDQGGARVVIEGPIAMTQSEQSHKYTALFAIPKTTYDGKVLSVEQEAVLTADQSSLYKIETIWVDAPLDNQTMKVSF